MGRTPLAPFASSPDAVAEVIEMTDVMSPVQAETDDERALRLARDRAQQVQGLLIHLLVYLTINAGLFVINVLTRDGGGAWWFQWPLMGWGIGLAVHMLVTVTPVFSPEWAERRAERMVTRHP